jgi:hypothetical protein
VVIQGNRVLHLRYRGAPMTDPSGYVKTLALPAGFDAPRLLLIGGRTTAPACGTTLTPCRITPLPAASVPSR